MKTTDSEKTRVCTVQCCSYRPGAIARIAVRATDCKALDGRRERASSAALAPTASLRATSSSDSDRQLSYSSRYEAFPVQARDLAFVVTVNGTPRIPKQHGACQVGV